MKMSLPKKTKKKKERDSFSLGPNKGEILAPLGDYFAPKLIPCAMPLRKTKIFAETADRNLALCWHGWFMDSAHHLTVGNIWPKFNENPSRHKRDMEGTRNSKLYPMTFNCMGESFQD